MSKIYIVTSGSYSDYRVRAVCSTREKAEHTATLIGERNDGAVEEFTLDDIPDVPPGRLLWMVWMDVDGNSEVYQGDALSADPVNKWCPPHTWGGMSGYQFSERASFQIWARDETHALKIANERRLQAIAEGRWNREEVLDRPPHSERMPDTNWDE